MGMSKRCTAPKRGHSSDGAAAKCPVHGPHESNRSAPAMPMAASPSAREIGLRAMDIGTSGKELADLSHNKSEAVKESVAGNPSTWSSTLMFLAAVGEPDTRWAVAKNPSTDVETLEVIATDISWFVRHGVVENPNATPAMLNALAEDDEDDVREFAVATIAKRIQELCGVDAGNTHAIESLRALEWWTLTAGDPDVVLARTLYPNS